MMTKEELKRIREKVYVVGSVTVYDDDYVPILLDEIERLQAENERLTAATFGPSYCKICGMNTLTSTITHWDQEEGEA